MLANTLTLTINSVAKVLTRINQDNYGSEYRLVAASERIVLKIRHSKSSSGGAQFDQHNVLVEWTKIPASPATPTVMTVSTTLRGQFGTDPVELDYLSDALGVLVAANAASIVQGDN
jgi:hypothetical protein